MSRPSPHRAPLLSALAGLLALAALLVLGTVVVPPGAQAQSAPTGDPLLDRQWALTQIGAPQAWPVAGGSGQVIAIVDSGVDRSHPDLAGKIAGGVTFVRCEELAGRPSACGTGDWRDREHDEPDWPPGSGHGTHVAGIAAAVTGNGVGIAGVAPGARLLSVKVGRLEEDEQERPVFAVDTADLAAGIRWAVANGADVINLSLGVAGPHGPLVGLVGAVAPLTAAVNEAVAAGVVVVAAAGNDFASICTEPAANPGVVCVVATDRGQNRAVYSNLAVDRGWNVVAAPGGAAVLSCADDVVSTLPVGLEGSCTRNQGTPGYDFMAGTSMAAPHVAGVAALLTGQGRTAADVVRVLTSTARTPGVEARGTFTPTYGWGIVDAAAAVAQPVNPGPVVERLSGRDRIATAAVVSRRTYVTAETVVIARADDYADALAGAPLATHLEGPLLLTGRGGLAQATADEVARLGARTAVLLGGEAALSAQVERDLASRGVETRRLRGANRFETAAAVAAELPPTPEVFVAEGAHADPARGWPDALSASALAANLRRPILLVTRDRLPAETAAALHAQVDVTIVGGRASVGDGVATELDRRAGTVRRLAGTTRYGTSVAVADEARRRGVRPAVMWIATGRAFADGLVAGAGAGATGGLLVLVDGMDLDRSGESRDWLASLRGQVTSARIAGGTAAVATATEDRIRALLE